jgi:hypothetical protein
MAHRAPCKRTTFSTAIHMLSTIAAMRNVMQSLVCAISCETQSQKHAHIRRLFSVAQFAGSAYSREHCRAIDNAVFAIFFD